MAKLSPITAPENHIPVCRPLLPTADKILPYLHKIDAARYYSNGGPLLKEFETRLADHFGVSADQVITSANGTLALTQMLRALSVEPGSYCVMPSWTFIATPAAVAGAQLIPYFIDVDSATWTIRPEDVLPLMGEHTIGAVIVVSPFGAPIPCQEWEDFSKNTGIRVIIDAAAGFDSFRKIQTTLPFMVSLHATKVLGMGEGAVVVTSDPLLTKTIRAYGNFGFQSGREAFVTGTNTKISEYAAAVGLAAFDDWPKKRESWQQLSETFKSHINRVSYLSCAPHFNEDWVSSFGIISIQPPHTADSIAEELNNNGIETVRWWGKGCHTHHAYRFCPHSDLSTTNHIAEQTLGVPFWLGLSPRDLESVFTILEKMGAH